MVAYSFQKQFAPLIVSGAKCQTIRKSRDRHARPGEALQLFVGMRTKSCRKIIPDPVCVAVTPIRLFVGSESLDSITVGNRVITEHERSAFARRDGFNSMAHMHGFWWDAHGPGWFNGVVIEWSPPLPIRQEVA